MKQKPIKCVLAGDQGVGKTSLLITFVTNKYPKLYVPPVYEYYGTPPTVNIGDQQYSLHPFEVGSRKSDEHLRHLAYPETDVFIVCFSTIEPISFVNMREKWIDGIRQHCPKTPFLLVGTQVDLRDDPWTIARLERHGEKPLISTQGEEMAKELKAVQYLECSALTQQGVKQIFEEAVLAALHSRKRSNKRHKCTIL